MKSDLEIKVVVAGRVVHASANYNGQLYRERGAKILTTQANPDQASVKREVAHQAAEAVKRLVMSALNV